MYNQDHHQLNYRARTSSTRSQIIRFDSFIERYSALFSQVASLAWDSYDRIKDYKITKRHKDIKLKFNMVFSFMTIALGDYSTTRNA